MNIFNEEIVSEYIESKNVNKNKFSWWSYVNLKADIQTALGFAKFFYPEIVEIDEYFLLKDKYDEYIFNGWKKACNNDKNQVEKVMNSYEVKDFFHINTDFNDKNIDEQVNALGEAIKLFWEMSFKHRYPDRNIIVDTFYDEDSLTITVFECENI
ncbi:hypothetical protein [Clostridium akagii]|uniref:hypothetical protein n=1 Tax=Clostridium akagii TaxID=91623 RepID=UPI00047B2375|nr:hypothetical protein [Clostridium akagii]